MDAAVTKITTEAAPLPPGAKPDPNPHPREVAMEAAAKELIAFLDPWVTRHFLTASEYLYLLAVPTHRQIQAMCLAERVHLAKQEEKP